MTCAAQRCPLSTEVDCSAAGCCLKTGGWQSIQNADLHVNRSGALSNVHLAADRALESHVPAQPLGKEGDPSTGSSCSGNQSPAAQTRRWDARSHSRQHCLLMALILLLHLSAVSAATPASSPAADLRPDWAYQATGYHDHAISSSAAGHPAAPAVSRVSDAAGSKPFDSSSDDSSSTAATASGIVAAGSKAAHSRNSLPGRQLQTAQRNTSERVARPVIPPGYSTGYSYYNPADFPLPPGYRQAAWERSFDAISPAVFNSIRSLDGATLWSTLCM